MTPDQFKEARQALACSQQRMAEKLGVSLAAVRAWEAGTNPVPGWMILALAALHFVRD